MLVQVHMLYAQLWSPKSSEKIHTYTYMQSNSLDSKTWLIWNHTESKPDQIRYETVDSVHLSHLCKYL